MTFSVLPFHATPIGPKFIFCDVGVVASTSIYLKVRYTLVVRSQTSGSKSSRQGAGSVRQANVAYFYVGFTSACHFWFREQPLGGPSLSGSVYFS